MPAWTVTVSVPAGSAAEPVSVSEPVSVPGTVPNGPVRTASIGVDGPAVSVAVTTTSRVPSALQLLTLSSIVISGQQS